MDRTIYITEDIIPTSGDQGTKENSLVGKVMNQAYALAAEGSEPIHVFIDTDGGSLKVALTIYDMLKATKCEIHTYGLSEVCSAGVIIYLAGDKRFAFKHTQFMTHPASLSAGCCDINHPSNDIMKEGWKGETLLICDGKEIV